MKYQEKKLGRYRKGVVPLSNQRPRELLTKIKYMRARYEGTCCACGEKIEVGQYIRYNPEVKKAKHPSCS